MEHQLLTEAIIGCAMKVHSTLGPGFLESVYQNALTHELFRKNLPFEVQRPISVLYDGTSVGDFFADILVSDLIIVELKAIQEIAIAHELQLVNYLAATRLEVGLLINFGAEKLEFKRKHRVFRPRPRTRPILSNPVHPV